MSRVYIAATLPLLDDAKKVAARLEAGGHEVVSTWHRGNPTIKSELAQDAMVHMATAETCVNEVFSAGALVLLYGPKSARHGSIFEAGIAFGAGLRVVACSLLPGAALPTILLQAFGVLRCDIDELERTLLP